VRGSGGDQVGPRPDLAVAIIARDNAETIGRTVGAAVALAGRVLVVDSGSTDGTIEIAEGLGAEVIVRSWAGHVAQKQFALEQCGESPWVLSLDSDESPEPELSASIRSALDAPPPRDVTGFEMNRRVWWAGRPLRHAWQPEWRLRLVRPGSSGWTGHDPHDRLETAGSVRRLAGILRHDAFRDVDHFIDKQVAHGRAGASSLHARGRRGSVSALLMRPPAAVLKQLLLKRGILDGRRGLIAATGMGLQTTVKYMRLLELDMEKRRARSVDVEADA